MIVITRGAYTRIRTHAYTHTRTCARISASHISSNGDFYENFTNFIYRTIRGVYRGVSSRRFACGLGLCGDLRGGRVLLLRPDAVMQTEPEQCRTHADGAAGGTP